MPTALTRAQQRLLEHLQQRDLKGLPPAGLPELCAELGLRSRGSMHKQVQALIDAGKVWPMDGLQRGVRLRVEGIADPQADADDPETLSVPMLGHIAAGRPIEAVADNETVDIPAWLAGRESKDCYALRIRGDSMRDIGILDDDLVLVRRANVARNGEVVVALIDGEHATLKRIQQRPGEVVLHAENPDVPVQRYSPEQVQIQGVLVAQLRRY